MDIVSGIKVMVGCGLIGAAALAAPTAAAARTDPFVGGWESVDTDGSHQTLSVTGAGTAKHAVALFDEEAAVCGGAPALVSGAATAEGATMVLRGALTCRPGGNPFRGPIVVEWRYDPATDTLADGFGVVWTRR